MFRKLTKSGVKSTATSRRLTTSTAKADWKTSTLSNGLKIASYENSAPMASIAFTVGSGTRHEGPLNKGLNALTSALAFNNSYDNAEANTVLSSFKINRLAEMHGITLNAVSGREFTYEILTGLKSELNVMGELGGKSFSLPAYEPWTVREESARLQELISKVPMEAAVIDDAHRGLYKNGLGSPVFLPTFNLKGFDETNALSDYLDTVRVGSNSMLIGVGTTHEQLVEIANTYLTGLSSNVPPQTAKPTVIGRNVEVDCSSDITHVCIGYDCTGVDPLLVGVIRNALGGSPRVKWGNGNAILHKKLSESGLTGTVNAIHQNYTDTSFLGVYMKAYPKDSQALFKTIDSALASLRSQGLSKQDIQRGKSIHSVNILEQGTTGLIECAMHQLSATGNNTNIKGPTTLAQEVNSFSDSDINNALKKIIGSKRSIAIRGDMKQISI